MPVLEVTALPQPDRVQLGDVASRLSEAVARVLGEEPRGTWVLWRTIEPGRYAEHGDAPALQPPATHPPVVRVTAYEGRTPATVAAVLTAIAEALAAELDLTPGNVLVRWDEVGAGRLYSGGRVVGA